MGFQIWCCLYTFAHKTKSSEPIKKKSFFLKHPVERIRKKHFKAHSTGYQRFLTDFQLVSAQGLIGHQRSKYRFFWENSFWWINAKVINIEQYFWLQYDSLVEPVRNICLTTSKGQFRSLTWGYLRSRSRVGSDGSYCISDDASWQDKHFGTNPMSVSLFNQKLLTKTMLVTSDDLSRGTLRHISAFLSITFDWIKTQTWGWYQCVCLVKTQQLTCNMTYLNHHVTLNWDDLRSNLKIDLSRSSRICFEPARRGNHIDVKIIVRC